jgi:hypothetical protein
MNLTTHRFADMTHQTDAGFTTPLWIVGENPFEDLQSKCEGYVVHLAQPRFIARWNVGGKSSANQQHPAGELTCVAHGIELCEIVWHDLPIQAHAWLIEACAAVAVRRGELVRVEGDGF